MIRHEDRGHRIGQSPSGSGHCAHDIFARSHECQIDRVTKEAVAGAGSADKVVGNVDCCEDTMDAGQNKVVESRPQR